MPTSLNLREVADYQRCFDLIDRFLIAFDNQRQNFIVILSSFDYSIIFFGPLIGR